MTEEQKNQEIEQTIEQQQEKANKEEITTKVNTIQMKDILTILLQITLVITLSIIQYIYTNINTLWNDSFKKLKSFYEKESIQKYVKDANETYTKIGFEEKIDNLKKSINEKYAQLKSVVSKWIDNLMKISNQTITKVKANLSFEKSISKGNLQSYLNLGTLYLEGVGVEQNFEKARKLFQ